MKVKHHEVMFDFLQDISQEVDEIMEEVLKEQNER